MRVERERGFFINQRKFKTNLVQFGQVNFLNFPMLIRKCLGRIDRLSFKSLDIKCFHTVKKHKYICPAGLCLCWRCFWASLDM